MLAYLIRVGDALSQLVNVTLLFGLNANESISGRCWRCRSDWRWETARVCIDWLFSPFESDHCRLAYYNDVMRAEQLLAELHGEKY